MTAVLLACLSAALFGVMTVVIRFALRRSPDPAAGALVTTGVGFLVALAVAGLDARRRGLAVPGGTWLFAAAGLLAPGGSQLFFNHAVRDAGPSRTSVVVGAAPLISVAIALAVLGEPFRLGLLVGGSVAVRGVTGRGGC